MKLNNKGFAITGILYTLFILFLLILMSVLNGLSTRKNLMEQSIVSQEDSFKGIKIENTSAIKDNITIVTGKYIFSPSEDPEEKCVAYLRNGINIAEERITYIPSFCNSYDEMIIEEVYSFEKE